MFYGMIEFLKETLDISTIMFFALQDHFTMPSFTRPSEQLWMLYLLECPLHTQNFKQKQVFNWTSTYRRDSTIVAPYERWYVIISPKSGGKSFKPLIKKNQTGPFFQFSKLP